MSDSRWTRFQEEHALDGTVHRLLARLSPRAPRPIRAGTAPRVKPATQATASVVIPCYNYGRFLPDAVRSALSQDGVEVEVIVVDDQSTDDSREVAAGLAEGDARVRLLVNPVNSGHVRSFNAGWEASTGEFVVKLDADDLLTPGSLSRAIALFEANPSVGLVYGHPRHFTTSTPPDGRVATVRWSVWAGRDWLAERCRLGVSAITNPEMVIRASFLRESGAMNPAVDYAPDMEISLRAAAVSDIGYVGGADQALHREHGESMSETDGAGTLVDLKARRLAFEHALEALPEPDRSRMLALAGRGLAEDALRFASSARDRGRSRSETEDLLRFAREASAEVFDSPEYRRLLRRADGGGTRAAAALRRARRRWRQERYHVRWMMSGV
ncbi:MULTISPECIES: glycosyltransferase family 2 protein [Microbacterium]|uniref:GalNAc(5)-diNAcBac-PP-undecaprenol beta-1,3-glucosyltransferase n=1 Tax=Microbacterium trichothecenolyticum TaxID=69370 RepID=A0A0M2HHN2_MICTR|nr:MULTISPECIES: glycosyltransferase family 2 protein [Microbacterium]KJL43816.1 GalNAc(5)-diNAcBac-PP-undecaprenol beta-1,3-glucosyltransferase [Microbacterium trichothecenolyticum]MDR7191198.1 GT2 family glycosyltransferase [Microbacterium sp. BE35]